MTLAALLEEARTRYAPSYDDGLTNHLPMCLTAMHRLGADDGRLRSFADAYAPKLTAASAWPKAQAFAHEVRSGNVDIVVRERLRTLLPGLAGAAFHGLIRVAYATMAKELDETAAALAYFDDVQQSLDVQAAGVITDISALSERLRAQRIAKPPGKTITERVATVAADPRFQDVISDLAVDKSTLSQVSGLAARWYLGADDFASLHILTGAHAVRTLRPWTHDERAADQALAVAALASFVVCGCPERGEARGLPRADDRELKARAIASDDDHLAKLVLAALAEEAAEGDAIYRIVATRAARRGTT